MDAVVKKFRVVFVLLIIVNANRVLGEKEQLIII